VTGVAFEGREGPGRRLRALIYGIRDDDVALVGPITTANRAAARSTIRRAASLRSARPISASEWRVGSRSVATPGDRRFACDNELHHLLTTQPLAAFSQRDRSVTL
jgi:hypothetical protein